MPSAAEEEEEALKKGLRDLKLTNSTYIFSAARYIIVVLSFLVIKRDEGGTLIGDSVALWTTISLVGLFFLPTAADADRQVDEALGNVDEYSRKHNLLSESFGVAKLYIDTVFANAATASTISAFVISLFALMTYATADDSLVLPWAYTLSVSLALAFAAHYFTFRGYFRLLLDFAGAHYRGELEEFCTSIGFRVPASKVEITMENFARWEKSKSSGSDATELLDTEWTFLFGLRLTLFYARVLDVLSSLADFFFVISFQPAASAAASRNLVGDRYAVTFQVFFYLGIALTGIFPLFKLGSLIHNRYKRNPQKTLSPERAMGSRVTPAPLE